MQIVIRRNNQDFGPYPVALVQKYLASGHLKPGDFARLEGQPPNAHRSLASILANLTNPQTPPQAPVSPKPVPPPAQKQVPVAKQNPPVPPNAAAGSVSPVKAHWWRDAPFRRRVTWALVAVTFTAAGIYFFKPKPVPSGGSGPMGGAEAAGLWQSADKHALSVGARPNISVRDLADLLRPPAGHPHQGNPLWQVRCIFRWIAENIAYDFTAVRTSHRRDPDPDTVLRSRVAVCEGYAALFTSLCLAQGIEAAKISGYWHVSREEIGRTIQSSDIGHAWNAAKAGDRWVLLDVTAAAGSISGTVFAKNFAPEWFDCPPEQMIRSHWPDEPRWQFLPAPVGRETFEKYPVVRPRFFAATKDGAALTSGTLPMAMPFLRLEVRDEYKFSAQFRGSDGRLFSAPAVKHAGVSPETSRLEVSLPPEAAPGGYVELFAWLPGEPDSTGALAAIFRVDAGASGAVPLGAAPTYYAGYEKRRARLDEPLVRNLPANSWQRFKIRVPGARNIRVLQGTLEYFLNNVGDDTFEAKVLVAPGKVGLYATFTEGATELEGLVGFEGK